MEKIGNENLEKISGGKADSEKSPSSNIDVTKLRQGSEMTCWRCGKKFRLGDAEIFHTECNQCRSGGIIESFNKMKGK
ncbi:MAG: hypothetical protein Q4B84_03335 [Clostridia bacterium]|nr:hypothetical protein [Clostridia bacterium]